MLAGKKRFGWGAVGAFVPVLVTLAVVDFQVILGSFTWGSAIGYMIRATALCALGGLAALAHKSETDYKTLMELGMAWPAVFIGGSYGFQKNQLLDTAAVHAVSVEAYVDSARSVLIAAPVGSEPDSTSQERIDNVLSHFVDVEARVFQMPDRGFVAQLRSGFFVSDRMRTREET